MTTEGKELEIEFSWGTFCRGILDEGTERSLYHVMPALAANIEVEAAAKGEAVQISIGRLALYAVIARRPGVTGDVSFPLLVEMVLEREGTKEGINKMELEIKIVGHHKTNQVAFRLGEVEIPIMARTGLQELNLEARFSTAGQVLGSVRFPIECDVLIRGSE